MYIYIYIPHSRYRDRKDHARLGIFGRTLSVMRFFHAILPLALTLMASDTILSTFPISKVPSVVSVTPSNVRELLFPTPCFLETNCFVLALPTRTAQMTLSPSDTFASANHAWYRYAYRLLPYGTPSLGLIDGVLRRESVCLFAPPGTYSPPGNPLPI